MIKSTQCLLTIFFISVTITCYGANIERRAAIDVGSGSTKVTIADVDPGSGSIISIHFEEAFPVPFQAALESSYDGNFDEDICAQGLETFSTIVSIAQEYEIDKIAGVATAAFRSAGNGKWYAEWVWEKTGLPLTIISQAEEGELAFYSATADSDLSTEDAVVWDIGTGSFQMTTKHDMYDTITVYCGDLGSIPFRNYIIDVIKGLDSDKTDTPNPMTNDDVYEADRYARAFARKAYPLIKDNISASEGVVAGIGRLFTKSVGQHSEDNKITRNDLREYIQTCEELSDEEMDNIYANVDVPNAVLVLACMKALHIQEIEIIDTVSTRGLLLRDAYWLGYNTQLSSMPNLCRN